MIKRIVRSVCGLPPFRTLLPGLVRLILKLRPELRGIFATELGLQMGYAFYDLAADGVAADLDSLPSETTPSERRFIYNYFAHWWPGEHDVLEIGPFLGGTTRAIGYGMLANHRRKPSTRLHTYDRFRLYYSPDQFERVLGPFYRDGRLPTSLRQSYGEKNDFRAVFDALHSQAPYAPFLRTEAGALPQFAEQVPQLKDIFALPAGTRFDAVFIDGCKSWYGTKYFMMNLDGHVEPGACFILQDYGWFTCFWLSAFFGLYTRAFRLLAHVDNTYAFELIRPLTRAEVEACFPDRAEDISEARFKEVYAGLIAEAEARQDTYLMTSLRLHLAGAMATIGNKDEARRVIREWKNMGRYPHWFRSVIAMAEELPTYRPVGDEYEHIRL